MYYEPGVTPHGLPFDPFKSCVIPRPIGWISTVDREGRHNLAPYSQFQNVTFNPPIGKLDKLSFSWYNSAGVLLNNNDCDWSGSVQIVETVTASA